MSSLITNIGQFTTDVLVPFLENFFTANIGIVFVCCASVIVVLGGLARLLKTKF